MRRRSLVLALAFVVTDPFTAPAAHPVTLGAASSQASARDQLYTALVGRWQGTLEARDTRDPSKRTMMPTVLEVARAADSGSVTLQLSYDDGTGKTVKESHRLTMDAAGQTLTWSGGSDGATQRYGVRSFEAPRPGRPLRMVLEGEGSDDATAATIRQSLVIGPNKLQLLRETQPTGKSAFGFRHRYDLTRTE